MRGVDRIARAAAVGEGERRTVGLVAMVFASIEAGRGLGDVGVNTLVLSRLPADALPYLYIVLGLGSLVIAIGFGAALGRVRKARLFAVTLGGVAGALVVERLLIATGSTAILPVVWLTVTGAGTIAGTICWTVATSTFDARQAKRLFPLCTAAAIAGYFVGSLVAGPLAAFVGTESLVVAQALLFIAAAAFIARVAGTSGATGWAPPRGLRRPITADVRAGFDEVRMSPLMRLVAIAYVLFSVLAFSVTFPFLLAARQEFPAEAELATALGALAAIVTATSFVISLTLANRIYARFGVVGAALVLPIAYVVGFSVWIVRFTFATAAGFAFVQQSMQRGLSNAAWSAMYNVVPARIRSQVLAFQDGVPGQLGVALSGVLLLTAARVLAPDQLFWIGLAAAAALTLIVVLIRRHYTESLLRTLRSGAAEQLLEGGPGLDDVAQAAEVRDLLIAALGSPDPVQRRMAATLLMRSEAPEARHALAGALRDADPGLRAAAASALLGTEADDPSRRDEAEAALDALLRGDSAERVAGAQALRRLGRTLPGDLMPAFVSDPSEDVRAAAMAILDGTDDGRAPAALVSALSDPTIVVRNAAADAIAERPMLPGGVVAVLDDPSADAQAAALRAMVGHRAEVESTVLAWAEAKAARAIGLADAAHHLRDGLGASGAAGATTGQADRVNETRFLCDVLDRRADRDTDLVLSAIAVLGAPEARGVIRRSLRSRDADVRAQAIEVLDSIGIRGLGHSLTRLADPGIDRDRATRDGVLAWLGDDGDPWIRDLARRIGRQGDHVPDASPNATPTLAQLETMLLLRRVPIFERLDPEDLARIAATATERSFGPNENLVSEGETGEELYVLLEGRVHVTRHESEGVERHVRDYSAGEHIGELAVLRDQPRAGTVIAGPQGVRALVIDGEGLKAILRERPDAAMAMLATLAERIITQ